MVVGEEGSMILPNASGPRFSPAGKFETLPRPNVAARNHYHHFVDACLGGEKTESHFEQTAPMTETILLGTVATRVPNTELTWDAKAMKFTGNELANQYLSRTYRKGW